MSLNLAALSTSAADETTRNDEISDPGSDAPRCWNPAGTWQHRPVARATEDAPRRPIIPKPENLQEDAPRGDRRLAEMYWRGSGTSEWPDLLSMVSDGFSLRKRLVPCDVALFPSASGLVVLDCDVKRYDDETGFVVVDNVASLAPPIVRYGLNDLRREVEALGHSMAELATYAVRTKSGGVHLYYLENPRVRLRNTGHRHEWRIDVVAHNDGADRSWVAAPPTPGYEVVRDIPVVELPDWLATWLAGLESHVPPVGHQRRQGMTRAAAEARSRVMMPVGENDAGLLAAWVRHELDLVREANQTGGWNLAIYQCVLNLLEVGGDLDQVAEMTLEAAAPVNDLERRRAMDTVGSAYRRHLRKSNGG